MTKLTTYTVTFRTEQGTAFEDIDAPSPQSALAEARAIADDRDRLADLTFDPFTGHAPVDEIIVEGPDCKLLAEWLSPELLLRLAAEDLFNALEKALTALNTARLFKVPKLGTHSYAIAAQCRSALDKADPTRKAQTADARREVRCGPQQEQDCVPGIIPNLLTSEAYTYSPGHRFGAGWALFDERERPNIQRIDECAAFETDADAAFHVLCAAAFDAGREGDAAREALHKIVRFGEQGLNPIATMLAPRRAKAKSKRRGKRRGLSRHPLTD